jgi:hypothetical protein
MALKALTADAQVQLLAGVPASLLRELRFTLAVAVLAPHLQDIFFGIDGSNTKLVTVFLGANDAARPDGPP